MELICFCWITWLIVWILNYFSTWCYIDWFFFIKEKWGQTCWKWKNEGKSGGLQISVTTTGCFIARFAAWLLRVTSLTEILIESWTHPLATPFTLAPFLIFLLFLSVLSHSVIFFFFSFVVFFFSSLTLCLPSKLLDHCFIFSTVAICIFLSHYLIPRRGGGKNREGCPLILF